MIGFSTFSGEVPRTGPRLLPANAATHAMNTRLESGTLEPVRLSRFEETMPNFCQTIYRFGGKWYGWAGVVNVAPAPIAADRLYIMGDGVPKVMIKGNTYTLKIIPPTVSLTATVVGTPDPDLSSMILYAYTWVTEYGEESEPSPLGLEKEWSPSLDVVVEGFQQPTTGRAITKQRIYKSQTSALGVTSLFFIHERDASTLPFTDKAGENPMGEPLPSTDYNAPPDDLVGLKSGPNGIMAAFRGKELYFCEPYLPHAWPEKYVLKTDYKIVALAWFDSSLAILTEGSPYVAQGIAPDSMAMERIRVNYPCVSPQGVVDLGYSVAYPSNEGLILVSASSASVVTAPLFTREQWFGLSPNTIVAGSFSGKYIMGYTKLGASESELLIIDLTGSAPFVSRSNQNALAMYNEVGTGELFTLRDGVDVYQWDSPDQPYAKQVWTSKPFVLPGHSTFGVLMVETPDLKPGDTIKVTITADDKTMTVTRPNVPVRLKAGFRALQWQVKIEGNVPVTALRLASGIDDLVGG